MAKRKMSTFERLKKGEMNRKQRRELARKLAAGNSGLTVENPNAGGIDVGNESHFVAVPPDRDAEPIREFGSWTEALVQMAEWLNACGVDTVAMQATGVYWIALYDILEQHGIRVVLVNAQHTKNVPGRKIGVQECEWLRKLHTYGLVRDSFRLPEQIESVRTIWRLRSRHVQEAGRAIQHMQKALTKMNVQLANVISDISGVSGQAIIAGILKGERDLYKLADLKDYRCKASREQAVDHYHFVHRQVQECDQKLEGYLAQLPTRTLEAPAQPEDVAVDPSKKGKKKAARKPRGNEPRVDLDMKAELKRICGVDLTSIDGISVITAQTILAEVGTDLSGFKNEHHFSSWLGLTPSRDISGGKTVRRGKKKVKSRLAGCQGKVETSPLAWACEECMLICEHR